MRNLMAVLPLVISSNLIAYPTSSPVSTPTSSATRFATDTAATRRGCVVTAVRVSAYLTTYATPALEAAVGGAEQSTCVTAMRPFQPASAARYCGICVVLPEPVSPVSTIT